MLVIDYSFRNSSSNSTYKANGVDVFDGCPILYNSAISSALLNGAGFVLLLCKKCMSLEEALITMLS